MSWPDVLAAGHGDSHAGCMAVITCAWCGTAVDPAGDPAAALTWTMSVEGSAERWFCPRCARDHLRSIEAKLDSGDW